MSLYEEYFSRYPGLITCLENARHSGRFAHSFLINTPDPVIKKEFPLVLSQISGCPNSNNGKPCCVCDFCRRIEQGRYPEFQTLSPVGKMYFIRVGDRVNPEPNTLRSFINRFYLTGSVDYPKKIGVILEADRMNDEAQNALLKTLEEPPKDSTLILCTSNLSALLPTTKSRCQIIPLPDNDYKFNESWATELFETLTKLIFTDPVDMIAAESGAVSLIKIAANLAKEAESIAIDEFSEEIENVQEMDDAALKKRLDSRIQDASSGAYIRERMKYLSAISTFAFQVYLLATGVEVSSLPNPEVFGDNLSKLPVLSEDVGEAILEETNQLLYTLNYNVPEELALRAFAVNIVFKCRQVAN
jgi:DNA polymerase III delta prime subunit